MTTAAKAASAVAAASTASAGGIYFGTDLLKSKKTITDLIREKNPNKRLITSTTVSDDAWKKAYKAYREENKEKERGQDSWKLSDWSKPNGNIQEADTTEEFINKCKSNSGLEASKDNDLLYQQVLKYCTRATLVSDLIAENNKGRRLLKSSGQEGEADWQKAWNVYKQQNIGKNSNPWSLADWDSKKAGNDLPTNYKTTCDTKSSEEAFKTDDEKYLNVLNWCTVPA
ncbi:hypothetical protein HF1_02760 [Mycoplasma haemofelis str. Langford 1]|uniref:Uncharacterized protein n=1 Tax=Mycoplasma haemofelis (strain Langford 1) TaxID=941640 RepID=E8ZGL3_MYCHL|nr:hypothetical protein [Mycoplasma haemofelis]CBY92284.1 hypothetical protein HF1_02760 [Mycoplasma haemofelis str. Langford 1]